MSLQRSRSKGRPKRIRWLHRDAVLAAHDASLARFGGAAGLRDGNLLDSALARPQQIAHYEPESPLQRLAAAYAGGIIQNHPFVDGNKRSGLLAAYMFLRDNGLSVTATEPDLLTAILQLAAGGPESDLEAFFVRHSEQVKRGASRHSRPSS